MALQVIIDAMRIERLLLRGDAVPGPAPPIQSNAPGYGWWCEGAGGEVVKSVGAQPSGAAAIEKILSFRSFF
jgi:hypothetical protein